MKQHPKRKGQTFERHQWATNDARTKRVCTICGQRQTKVSGRWTPV